MALKTVEITSTANFAGLLKASKIVVTNFHADWCGPCKAIAPLYEQFSDKLSRPKQITFVKVNIDLQQEIAQKYNVTSVPTFMIFKQGTKVDVVTGANVPVLERMLTKLAQESEGSSDGGYGEPSGDGGWRSGELPKGYSDVTDQIDVKGLELLNADSNFGGVRVLFEESKPSALSKGKAPDKKDWVESDTDEQLMMFLPFQSMLKVHTLQITSLPHTSQDDDELPMRPQTLQIYANRPHILGFEEAEDIPSTQTITLSVKDWNSTGTATVPLRFVKFQNITSLVIFIVDGEGSGERIRIDRFRIIGETGEKRDQGKLEKIDHDH
ncbi:PITH domain-containing protein [Calycina marina]|uniref:PITH domain-containing protein n=1 Tax=Calycina marina TaxID=1763456 RepID=A0A9P7YWY6_9HELO|nr:PITH domain-containing protein [Calycina marina]